MGAGNAVVEHPPPHPSPLRAHLYYLLFIKPRSKQLLGHSLSQEPQEQLPGQSHLHFYHQLLLCLHR